VAEGDHDGEECVQLEQTVRVLAHHIEVEYSFSQRTDDDAPDPCPAARHPTALQESPALFAWPGDTKYDDDRLTIDKLYDGVEPWKNKALSTPDTWPSNWFSPSEQWIGIFREGGDEYGLTLAYPARTLHQPYPHIWTVHHDDFFDIMWARPFMEIVRDSDETISISWTVYIIPGAVEEARAVVYDLLPHRNWEFELRQSELEDEYDMHALEGWRPHGQLTINEVENGVLRAKSNGSNPKMISLDQLDFAADSIEEVEIHMKVTAGTQGVLQWATEENPTFWNSEPFNIVYGSRRSPIWHTYRPEPTWSDKTIKRLRLQPTNATTVANGIKIDYIRLVQKPEWTFDSEGNNEGWMPVTRPLTDPAWPAHVTDGDLVLYSGGVQTDDYTDPTTNIVPTLLGPYPTYINEPASGGRAVQIGIELVGGPPGSRTVRLRYTCTDPECCAKAFEYHPYRPDNKYGYPAVSESWPFHKMVTRFDLGDHDPIVWGGLARNTYHELEAALPSTGDIDQLLLEPTNKPGTVYIDYIRVVATP
jgi:hypothetical protein